MKDKIIKTLKNLIEELEEKQPCPILEITKKIEVMPHDLDGEYTFEEAIEAAKECTYAGHTGWRLPTKHELNELYEDKETIGGFKLAYYWSSTEYNNNRAWFQAFSNGFQYDNGKNNSLRVRCLRDI